MSDKPLTSLSTKSFEELKQINEHGAVFLSVEIAKRTPEFPIHF
jgi:hypothetical protein